VMLAQAALGRIRQTSARVAQILTPKKASGQRLGSKPGVALVGAFALICGVWSTRVPRLIGFSGAGNVEANQNPALTTTADLSRFAPAHGPEPAIPSPRAVEVKFNPQKSSISPFAKPARAKVSPLRKPALSPMVKLAAATEISSRLDVLPVTQTWLVLTENPETGSEELRVYQLQMLRITVLHPALPAASARLPHKEI
jgi:hypothetical protein